MKLNYNVKHTRYIGNSSDVDNKRNVYGLFEACSINIIFNLWQPDAKWMVVD